MGSPWTATGSKDPSGYTPIHQAAWHGASVEEVQRLLNLGAWRTQSQTFVSRPSSVVSLTNFQGTLRTINSDDTALDIARQFRYTHLYDILAPVIRHPLSSTTILKLEKSLHDLIATECDSNEQYAEARDLRLSLRKNAKTLGTRFSGWPDPRHDIRKLLC